MTATCARLATAWERGQAGGMLACQSVCCTCVDCGVKKWLRIDQFRKNAVIPSSIVLLYSYAVLSYVNMLLLLFHQITSFSVERMK